MFEEATEVRLKITLKLVGLVILNALLIAVLSKIILPAVDCKEPAAVKKPVREPVAPILPRVEIDNEPLPQPEPSSVNETALGEKKTQGPGSYYYPNSNIPIAPTPTRESELSYLVRQFNAVIRQTSDGRYHCVLNSESLIWNATNHRSTNGFAGTMQVAGPLLLEQVKQGARFAGTPAPPPTTPPGPSDSLNPINPINPIRPIVDTPQDQLPKVKAFDLALFLDGSVRSQEIRQWFETDRDLRAIREQCNFQIYTPENPTYRTRLTHIVSTNNFPALVLTYADGGHIHAAAEKFIPTTAPKLAADLYYFAKLAKTAREDAKSMGLTSQTIGLMKQATGYSWDKMISPSLQLQDETGQCPDGRPCPIPTPNTPNVPDIDNPSPNTDGTLVDRLNKDALLVTGPRDYMAIGIIVCLFLALLVARNRGMI